MPTGNVLLAVNSSQKPYIPQQKLCIIDFKESGIVYYILVL
jgi:hypothetical protein